MKKWQLLTITGLAMVGSILSVGSASAHHHHYIDECNTFPPHRPHPQPRHDQPTRYHDPHPHHDPHPVQYHRPRRHRPAHEYPYTLRPVINYQDFYRNPDLNPPIIEPPPLMDMQSMVDVNSERAFIVLIVLIFLGIWGPIFKPKKDSK
ncbi:MAG: hypothetical protein P5702_02870 [Limnospira sp. PMC 1291.21]|uniref:Uncharacterized protein n=3 Tax=Limnospira TaxID=2596745 RepID=A0A9P1KHC8_9CYAN|nr:MULTISPECIES: hypothetical protein [Limnospira]EKD08201.1 hypothetical protein SPLC1_S271230 [Arthrospira platensis C1]MDC0839953.1 hypothetical protein [Limnoraphis robusta]MDY7055427.1 hypothetical protein [Limnospira fusiformis LS22]QJB25252.1 hypothetical protein HFV01_04860 [Limnospira fusiformis SAG 85.79]RAQ40321.1 hypothetical protein B9S53_16530 [Arthrospira sp. O9.13F]